MKEEKRVSGRLAVPPVSAMNQTIAGSFLSGGLPGPGPGSKVEAEAGAGHSGEQPSEGGEHWAALQRYQLPDGPRGCRAKEGDCVEGGWAERGEKGESQGWTVG